MPIILRMGLENAAAASALALVAAVAGLGLRRHPALRHFLWLLVLVKLVTPPVWTVPVGWAQADTSSECASGACDASETCRAEFAPALDDRESGLIDPEDSAGFEEDVPQPNESPRERLSAAAASAAAVFLQLPWPTIVPWVWSLGSAVMLALMFIRIQRFRRALALAKPAAEHVVDEVDRLALALGLPGGPEVVTVPGEVSPVVWSLGGSAVMVIPSDLCKLLTGQQFEGLVTHELAHLARRDHWVRQFELVVTILFWWLPVVWWARRGLRDAEEQCCDAWVVWAMPGASRAYAETLLEAVDFLSRSSNSLPVAASGFGHVQHLKRRLVMIMSGNSSRTLTRGGAFAALGFAALLLPFTPTWGQQPDEKEKKEITVVKDGENPEVITGAIAIELDDLKLVNLVDVDLQAIVLDDVEDAIKVGKIEDIKKLKDVIAKLKAERAEGAKDKEKFDDERVTDLKKLETKRAVDTLQRQAIVTQLKSLQDQRQAVLQKPLELQLRKKLGDELIALDEFKVNLDDLDEEAQDGKDAPQSAEQKAAIAKLKAEVKAQAEKVKAVSEEMRAAHKSLADAQKRLAEASRTLVRERARADRRVTVRVERRDEKTTTDKPGEKGEKPEPRVRSITPPVRIEPTPKPGVFATPRGRVEVRGRVQSDDQEKRLSDLEKKLDKILGELQNIKKTERR